MFYEKQGEHEGYSVTAWVVSSASSEEITLHMLVLLYGTVSEPHDEVAWIDCTEVAQQLDVC